jgi:hypothetical protein
LQPPGISLDAWLTSRAPAPIDEALALIADVADAIHGVHLAGSVLRDLEPRSVVLADDHRIWLTDVGLARLNVLSSRSASSLMLESTPYVAPETLRSTVVDPRADVYTIGVILWRALTGTLPYGDVHIFMRNHHRLPVLSSLRQNAPEGIDQLLTRCLAEDPERRPESARDVAEVLRGGPNAPQQFALTLTTCQSCGQPLRAGMRLCLACGKVAVRDVHTAPGAADGESLYLLKATEDAEFLRMLRDFFVTAGETVPALDFLVGDVRMYGKDERSRLQTLPARLFSDLPADTAGELAAQLRTGGAKIKRHRQRSLILQRRWGSVGLFAGIGAIAGGVAVLATGGLGFGLVLAGAGVTAAIWGAAARNNAKRYNKPPMARLRAGPAALPASDPLVARLAALLTTARSPDLRERVSELALLVQRVCDQRAERSSHDTIEVDAIVAPLVPLIDLIVTHVRDVARVDDDLADLDEGAMVRALAASEARREPAIRREPLLAGLDRLRGLEDQRSKRMQQLLEASSLLRRAVTLSLGHGIAERADQAELALARAALEDPELDG